MALVFLRQLAAFRDPFAAWSEDAALLLGTGWGRTWIWASAAAALLPAAALVLPRALAGGRTRQATWIAIAFLAAAAGAYPALSGHAAGGSVPSRLLVPADVVHVLAAGSWIGGLLVMLAAARAERRRGGRPGALLAELVPLFSPLALVSAGLLAATGTLAAFFHLESAAALATTPYGRLLSLKVALVVAVMVFGAVNWRRLSPLLASPDADLDAAGESLAKNAARELIAAQLVILVTALLVRTSPLGG